MKVTKLKANQILIEDNSLKDIDLNINYPSVLSNSVYNTQYEGLLLLYRFPDMGHSKQLIYGNRMSIYTLICSCLESLVRTNVIREDSLDDIVKSIKENIKKERG